jgi:hypothetical protein
MTVVRILRVGQLAVALVLALTSVAAVGGCSQGQGGGSAPVVKDEPPSPGELTSDDFIKQQAKSKTKARPGTPQRR